MYIHMHIHGHGCGHNLQLVLGHLLHHVVDKQGAEHRAKGEHADVLLHGAFRIKCSLRINEKNSCLLSVDCANKWL
jgi:hypothetical protein